MNLTAKMKSVIEELRTMREFNGIPLIQSHCDDEEQKRMDGASDGMSEEVIQCWVDSYTCCGFHFDTYDLFNCEQCDNENSYMTVEFNERKFKNDLREWLIEKIGDASVVPKDLDIQGGDNEFMIPNYGERMRELENSIDE